MLEQLPRFIVTMNRLDEATRAAILRCLVEGSSIRSTARITGTSKATVLKLLVEVGEFCSFYQDQVLRGLSVDRLELDEIWSFVGAKAKNATQPGQGDVWTFTAIDPDSKLMLSWLVGARSPDTAEDFLLDVASRVTGRIQLTTDGHGMYVGAVRAAFAHRIDYAQLVKMFGKVEQNVEAARRYSPAECTGARKVRMIGNPDMTLVSTSYVERSNLTLRMTSRRFTRLTNAFSKKVENHAHAVSLAFMAYNFVAPHGTLTKKRGGLKTTPAMAAGITTHPWTVEDILARMDPDRRL